MGLRNYQRQIAKERLKALGLDKVNRRMGREQDGIKNWRRALTGETGKAAEQAQMRAGGRAVFQRKRRIRKVGA